jgi:hypothetical protein
VHWMGLGNREDLLARHIFSYLLVHIYYLYHLLYGVLLHKDIVPSATCDFLEQLEFILPSVLLRHQLSD